MIRFWWITKGDFEIHEKRFWTWKLNTDKCTDLEPSTDWFSIWFFQTKTWFMMFYMKLTLYQASPDVILPFWPFSPDPIRHIPRRLLYRLFYIAYEYKIIQVSRRFASFISVWKQINWSPLIGDTLLIPLIPNL